MGANRSFRRLTAAALVVAIAAGGALLFGRVANAAPAAGTLGTLTLTAPGGGSTGSDLTIPTALTSGPCPTTASAANMVVTGPVGAATQTFPPDNPFPIRTTQATSFSTARAFNIAAGRDLKNAADSRGTQLAAGEYDFTVHCVDLNILTDFGTFTGAIFFTSPTAWQTNDPNGGSTTTTTTLTPSPAGPVDPGTAVTLNAAVSPAAAGSVQFKDGASNIGTPVTVSSGAASTSTSALASGSHSLTAVFTPTDPTAFTGSTSPAVTYVVNAGGGGATATSTVLGVTPVSPAAAGATETLTATVTPSAAVGSVQFVDGTTNVGDPVAVSGGTASATATLASGSHSLTAVFTPTDATAFAASTSSAVSYVVNAGGGATATSTVLGATPASPAAAGATETLTVTVTPSAAVGSVQFVDGTTNIGDPVDVSGGTATSTATLASGTHSLTAVFTPTDATAFAGSTSSAVTYVVNGGGGGATATSTVLGVTPASPVAANTVETLKATVTPSSAVGTVQFKDQNTNIGTPVPVANGTASATTTLGSGTHRLTAVFTPTDPATFKPSRSRAVSLRVNGSGGAQSLERVIAAVVANLQSAIQHQPSLRPFLLPFIQFLQFFIQFFHNG
ncbi:MAG TPA: Ig-like domain-containing protein [Pseudonocardiaceae bacterium]